MSKRIGYVLVVSVLLAGLSATFAQEAPPARRLPPAGNVLKHIPAGCMGFVVVNNVADFTDKIDGFIKAISPEGQPLLPEKVLDKIRRAAKLGEGFNANGGFAVVMLDPQVYGVDIVEMIAGEKKEPKPGEAPKKEPLPPVILIVPTTDKTLTNMLANYNPVKEGNYVKIQQAGAEMPMYCMVAGNYAMIGPNLKAVQNMAGGVRRPVITKLSATDKAVILRNDVSGWINIKMIAPIANAAMTRMEKEMAKAEKMAEEQNRDRPNRGRPGGQSMIWAKAMSSNFPAFKEMLKQLDDVSFGLRITKDGIMVEGRCSYLPNSIMGKALSLCRPVAGSLLNRLPSMPYVVAFGARNEPKTPKDFNLKQIKNVLDNEPFKDLTPEAKAKCLKVWLELDEQIESIQVYAGGITTGTGQVGAVCVLECKSAEKVKALLADSVVVANEVIKGIDEREIKKLTVKYHKALEAVGARKVDVIDIDHPELLRMDEGDRQKMKAILGEDKVRLLITAVDKKTLVITIGGSKSLLVEAMKTAKGTGTLHTNPGITRALAKLPKKRTAVVLYNIGNIFKVVTNIVAAIGEEMPPIPPIVAEEPLAGSISIEGTDISAAGYIPTSTISEVVKAYMAMMQTIMGGMGPGAMPPPGP
ncbi:MAG: hypothetical protein KAV00_14565 [Phycisphaerae bacterium]|nr:hypothetical protein [Phycisphaerae bacterium]